MDVSLDTDITIHLYQAGREKLLFKYFDKLYMHEFILERKFEISPWMYITESRMSRKMGGYR